MGKRSNKQPWMEAFIRKATLGPIYPPTHCIHLWPVVRNLFVHSSHQLGILGMQQDREKKQKNSSKTNTQQPTVTLSDKAPSIITAKNFNDYPFFPPPLFLTVKKTAFSDSIINCVSFGSGRRNLHGDQGCSFSSYPALIRWSVAVMFRPDLL